MIGGPAAPLAWLIILAGPFIGSFLGVLADRLPRGEDAVRKRSQCRACAARLGWRDLVPVLSFALSRGRCRHCGATLPAWLLNIEIVAAGVGVLAVIVAQSPLQMVLSAVLLWLLTALFFADLTRYRLPDALTLFLFATALALAWEDPSRSLLTAGLSGLAASGAFLALRLGYRALRGREGLGLGDVKLMAGIGAALGPWGVAPAVLAAALAALGVVLVQSLTGRAPLSPVRPVPFGSYLCLAAGGMWLWLCTLPGNFPLGL